MDDGGAPIFDAEYDGYDDNGTPDDETDDNYIYIIRYYVLQDNDGVDASQGKLQLYDPSLGKVRTWNVAGLACVTDTANDGLHATAAGVHHAVRVPVPVGQFTDEGIYRFVLHMKDDHASEYRDHRLRWALDLNSTKAARVFYTEDDWMVAPSGQSLRVAVRHPKYKQAFAEGNWTAKYAPDNYCTQVPYQHLMQENDYSGYSYEWFDNWGSRNGLGNPHRFVHVVGAAFPSSIDYRADPKWGYSDLGFCALGHTARRWSFVFVEKSRYWYEEQWHGDCDAEILLCAIHEVGHSAFNLSDHDTPEYTKTPCPVAAPPHLMECVMCQGEPDSRTRDFRFCSGCLTKIKAYGDCGW